MPLLRDGRADAGALASDRTARAGPFLLAHIPFCKHGLHLPLHRQSTTYAREGADLEVSTLADWGGAASATLMSLVQAIRAHVFAAERIHADDTTVPVLAKGNTRAGRLRSGHGRPNERTEIDTPQAQLARAGRGIDEARLHGYAVAT